MMTMKTMMTLMTALMFGVMGLAHESPTCQGHDHAEEQHDHAAEVPHSEEAHDHDHAAEEKVVEVPRATQKLIGLVTQRAEQRVLRAEVTLRGRFEQNPDGVQVVTAPVAGRVSLLLKAYDAFSAGEIVAKITSPDLQMRAGELAVLRKRWENYQQAGIANAELDMQIQLKQGEWDALTAGAEVVDGAIVIRALEAGTVAARSVAEGTWVEMGSELYQMAPVMPLRFKALLPTAEAARLKPGLQVHYGEVLGDVKVGIVAEAGLTPVYVYFAQAVAGALDGLYAEMTCVTQQGGAAVVAVPKRAVLRMGIHPTVFIRDPHHADRFIACEVTLGERAGEWIAVEGLPHHGQVDVVTAGQYELKLALPTAKPQAAGHYHADGTFHTGDHE